MTRSAASRPAAATLAPMIRTASRSLAVWAAVAVLALAGCGGSKTSGATKSWAEQLCSNVTSLTATSDTALSASLAADKAANAGAAAASLEKPLKAMQDGIVAIDEVFSSTTIVNTPMENVRNQIGKQLKNVYPAYDAVDAFNSAIEAVGANGSATKALDDLQTSLGGAKQGVADLKTAIGAFKSSKEKEIAAAFKSGPECKKIK